MKVITSILRSFEGAFRPKEVCSINEEKSRCKKCDPGEVGMVLTLLRIFYPSHKTSYKSRISDKLKHIVKP